MLEVRCSGTPHQVGLQHGRAAQKQVQGSIEFYKNFFLETAKLSWPEVCKVAIEFMPILSSSWPHYIDEMRGVAEGAGVDFASVLALNVRTEIAFGMATDGCTAFAWKTKDTSFIAQNWDWRYEQRWNVVRMHIEQPGKPSIHMMTEGGIIGKIGLNSSGVGVTLNAIQAKGVNYQKLPVHLALRTVLESGSRKEAHEKLKTAGVAAACHITISDEQTGGIGLECSAFDIVDIAADEAGRCTHSNHYIRTHPVESKLSLPDSPIRLARINALLEEPTFKPTMDTLRDVLKDKYNYPGAICRGATEKSSIETLFSIVMDLGKRDAWVKMGQPSDDGEQFELRP